MPPTLLTQAVCTLAGSALLSLALYLFLAGRARRAGGAGGRRGLRLKRLGPTALCAVAGGAVLGWGLWTVSDEPQEPGKPAGADEFKRGMMRQYHSQMRQLRNRGMSGRSAGAVGEMAGCPAVAHCSPLAGLSRLLVWYEPASVGLDELLENAPQYDGWLVRVRGTVHGGRQRFNGFPPVLRLTLRAGGREVRVHYPGIRYFRPDGGEVTILGTFHDDDPAWLEAVPEGGPGMRAPRGTAR